MKISLTKTQILLSVLIGAIFTLSLVPAALYFPAQRLLLNPDAVTEAILTSDITEEIPNLMAESLESNPEVAQLAGSSFLNRLDRDDYREILKSIAPPEWMIIQSAVLARQTQEFFLGNSNAASFSLDLGEVKARLSGDAAMQVAEIIVSSWDACTTDQLIQFGLAVASGSPSSAYPVCQPPDEFRPLVLGSVETALRQFAEQIPQEMRFEAANIITSSAGFGILQFVLKIWPWTPWLALGLGLLMAAVLGGSLRSTMMGVGVPISLAGMIDFGIVLVFLSMRERVVLPWLASWMQWLYPSTLAMLLTPALASLIGRFFLSAMIWSGAFILAGFGLFVLSRVVRRQN